MEPPKFQTHSEGVFWKICVGQGYEVEALPTREKEGFRTADFRVKNREQSFIAEVEEIRLNPDDLRQIRDWKKDHIKVSGRIIGARARDHIREAADQLKAHVSDKLPLVIVLYNSIRSSRERSIPPMDHLESFDVDAAMYGEMVVEVALNPNTPIQPDRNGGKRTLTIAEKTYISAVAVMSNFDDGIVMFYHNHFAAIPLPHSFFAGQKFSHFEKAATVYGTPWQWNKRE